MNTQTKVRATAGFTLLEILVATTIMGIAVVSLMSSLSTSMRNATHITQADRVSQIARNKMEELVADPGLPFQGTLQGQIDESTGWTAQMSPFEMPPRVQPGTVILQRIALVVWWKNGSNDRQYPLEAYRIVSVPRPAQ
jgi:general secretion pathway protein I